MYCDTLKQNSNYSVDRKGIRMTLMTSPVLHLTIYIYDDDDDDDDSQNIKTSCNSIVFYKLKLKNVFFLIVVKKSWI